MYKVCMPADCIHAPPRPVHPGASHQQYARKPRQSQPPRYNQFPVVFYVGYLYLLISLGNYGTFPQSAACGNPRK